MRVYGWPLRMSNPAMVSARVMTMMFLLSSLVFAQGTVNIGSLPPTSHTDQGAWLALASSIVSMIGGVAYLIVNNNSSAKTEKQRADALEREMIRIKMDFDADMKEAVKHIESLTKELKEARDEVKRTEVDRNQWMKNAYSVGFKSREDIPVVREPK